MKLPFRAAWLVPCFAVCIPGCGKDQAQYVEFTQTEPSKLDEKQAAATSLDSEGTPVASSPSEQTPANAAAPGTSAPGIKTPPATVEKPETPIGLENAPDQKANPATASPEDSTAPAENLDSTAVQSVEPGTVSEVRMAKEGDAAPESTRERPLVTSSQSGLQGPADTPVVENSAVTEPRRIELLIPELRLRKERGTDALRVTYDDIDLLKVLNMEPVPVDAVEFFPEWLKSLDGKPIRIRGFMYPTFEATGLTSFTLARDNGICCFVRQPKIYDIIGVTLAAGETTDYIEGRPFDVEGTFRIVPQADEMDLSRLYSIENAKVLH